MGVYGREMTPPPSPRQGIVPGISNAALLALSLAAILLNECLGGAAFRLLASARAPRSSLLAGASSPPPPYRGPPFCAGSTTALCDGLGEVAVHAPAWALAGAPPPAREMAVLPDLYTFSDASQYGETRFAAREYFFGLEGGLIVESGALDGMQYSTSWGLANNGLGWRAVHIEANPENFAALVRNRPEAININAGLCSADLALHYVSDAVVREAGVARTFTPHAEGLTPVSGFWEFMSPAMRARWWAGLTDAHVATFPETPCRALSHLLQLFGVRHVNLWILDVEGAESSVLAGFDFGAVRVDVVGIELDGTNSTKDDEARAVLSSNGFALHRRGHPYPFRHDWDERQLDNQGPSYLGLDNEWWLHESFALSFEASVRYSRGDTEWSPSSQQYTTEYPDSSACCFSRDPTGGDGDTGAE
jgi:hypothetical protein